MRDKTKPNIDQGYTSPRASGEPAILPEKIPVLLLDFFAKRSPRFGLIAGFISLLLVSVLDYLTGDELVMALLYIVPVIITAWLANRRWVFSFPVLCAVSIIGLEILGGHKYSHPLIPVWNGLSMLGIFLIISGVFVALKQAFLNERRLARYDVMTGIPNRKMFYEEIEKEVYRTRRYKRPITVAFVDVDNFKHINDSMGHDSGDELLRLIASIISQHIRVSDMVARMGGDEFVLMLPETDEVKARIVIDGLMAKLNSSINKGVWPISFSFGVVSCESGACDAKEMIKQADEVMYVIKRSGKNNVKYCKL